MHRTFVLIYYAPNFILDDCDSSSMKENKSESPDLSEPISNPKPSLQDPHVRDMVMEVIFGINTRDEPKSVSQSPEPCTSDKSEGSTPEKNRPLRSRTKPVQKDFLYDYNFASKKQGSSKAIMGCLTLADNIPNALNTVDNLLKTDIFEDVNTLHLKDKPLKVYKRKGKDPSPKALESNPNEKGAKQEGFESNVPK